LISFLKKVKNPIDDIDVLVDTAHVSQSVVRVVEHFKDDINVYERDFCGNFSNHRNFQISKCTGDYVFIIDADEIPQESLIRNIEKMIQTTGADIIAAPRINISPGYTSEWLQKTQFSVNEVGWIHWPDYQFRIFKNNIGLKFENELHERIQGSTKIAGFEANPNFAIWHIKSVDKQDNRWENHKMVSPTNSTVYDSLC
jgi:glycosyltransferase involved in cell wall biosynthesis